MASPVCTEMSRTPKKEQKQARKSSLSSFHNRKAALQSISPITADIIIAARIRFGV